MPANQQTTLRARYAPWLYYLAITLLILLPLLVRGFVLTLDMVFTPHIAAPKGVDNTYAFTSLLHALNYILPADIIQKLILLSIFFFGGLGMHRLHDCLVNRRSTQNTIGAYAAGTFYLFNPFVYSRFMAGQYLVLLGVMLLPWVGMHAAKLVRHPTKHNAYRAAAVTTLLGIVSIHLFAVALLMSALCAVVAGIVLRKKLKRHKQLLRMSGLSLGIVGIASSYWLLPLVTGIGKTAESVAGFSRVDQQAFATTGGSLPLQLVSVLRLMGFWADGRGLYLLPNEMLDYWPLLSMLIIMLVILGAYRLSLRKQLSNRILLACVGVAAVCATGFGINWLGRHMALFGGFREPQKFVCIVAIGYAVWFGEGLQYIHAQAKKYLSQHPIWPSHSLSVLTIIAVSLPLLWTRALLWGAAGQLYTTHYPTDWYKVADMLHDAGSPDAVFLPWHEYMQFDFAGRIIASPATAFFGSNVYTSKDPELGQLPPESGDEKTIALDPILKQATFHDPTQQLLRQNIRYIIVAKQKGYLDYRLHGATILFDGDSIQLYTITRP